MRQRPVARAAHVGVGFKRLFQRRPRNRTQRQRPNLAVDVGADSALQQAYGADDAVVDGGVEVKEGEGRRQVRAPCGHPVARGVDRPHGLIGNAL